MYTSTICGTSPTTGTGTIDDTPSAGVRDSHEIPNRGPKRSTTSGPTLCVRAMWDRASSAGRRGGGTPCRAPSCPVPVGCPSARRWPTSWRQAWLAFACGALAEGLDDACTSTRRAYAGIVVSLGDYVLNGGEVASSWRWSRQSSDSSRGGRQCRVARRGGPRGRPARVSRLHQTSRSGRPRHRASRAADPVRQPLRDRAISPTAAGAHRPPTDLLRPSATGGALAALTATAWPPLPMPPNSHPPTRLLGRPGRANDGTSCHSSKPRRRARRGHGIQ